MSGLSIQINRFGVGSSSIDLSKINPVHQKKIQKLLRKIFTSQIKETQDKEIPLRLRFNPNKPTLVVGNKEIPLKMNHELKRIGRIVRYYQNTGLLPKASLSSPEEITLKKKSKEKVQNLNSASVPGTNGSVLAGIRVADDTLSLIRNVIYSLSPFGAKDPIAQHLGYYSGIFWSFFSLRELDDGFIELKRSRVIGDKEGEMRAGSRIFSGAILSLATASFLAAKICSNFISAPPVTALLSASNVLFGLGSLLSVGISTFGVVRCYRFNKRLDEYIKNKDLTMQERMRGAIQFLKDSISITPEERAHIIAKIQEKHPDLPQDQKEKLLAQKLSDLIEVKVKYLKRRTSNKSLKLILDRADEILNKLNDPKQMLEGILDATILINTIQKESKIKMSLYILGFIAGLISLVAMALMSFMTAGAAPFILYGIAASIYLAITIYTVSGYLLKKGEEKLSDIQLFQNTSRMAVI